VRRNITSVREDMAVSVTQWYAVSLLFLRVLQDLNYSLISNLTSVLEDRYMWAEREPDK
jgi:hypothetical protein